LEADLEISLPLQLRELLAVIDGFEDLAAQRECAWSCDCIAAENRCAWRPGSLPRTWLAYGADGAGTCFCVHLEPGNPGVAQWSWIGQGVECRYVDLAAFWRA